ncbi:hypothetical protein MMC25_007947 [Agyrium rufum]|nr:hypothetical protein [Agyrium rufum]
MAARLSIFGNESPWENPPTLQWKGIDDRVRGGSSQSYLSFTIDEVKNTNTNIATFYGVLDTQTLGGAGFASQSTTPDQSWDLSAYDGLEIEVEKADGKLYTLNVKDEANPPKRGDGREQSSLSWEFDFRPGTGATQGGNGEKKGTGDESFTTTKYFVPWSGFTATYRGREKKDAGPLKTGDIKRFSLMMRSFFTEQEGPFEIIVRGISAVKLEGEEKERRMEDFEGERTALREARSGKREDGGKEEDTWGAWFRRPCAFL